MLPNPLAEDAPTVHVLDDPREPSDAELSAIEAELPAILADIERLDVEIITLDRAPTELDARRTRRAEHRLMTVRRNLANAPHDFPAGGVA